ncbi:MAG: hypothetical protein FJ171_09785 [Gammaproteobacteria bacterium]|nr:hypothetical protein [Gammaproteobacteria bacterium]
MRHHLSKAMRWIDRNQAPRRGAAQTLRMRGLPVVVSLCLSLATAAGAETVYKYRRYNQLR